MGTALNCIKKIILFFAKQILLAISILIIFFLIVVGTVSLIRSKYEKKVVKIKHNSYLVLNFSNGVVEHKTSVFNKKKGLYRVIKGINSAATDQNISGILLNIDNVPLSRNHIEEIGAALDKFKKSRKKIYAFTRNINNRNYQLGVYADKILMPPTYSALIDLKGYYIEMNYFKNLANYMGIKFNVINVGNYKTYGERYNEYTMSKEFKSDIKRIYNKRYNYRVEEIAKRRNLNKTLINSVILNGKLAMINPIYGKKIHLIDYLSYYSDLKSKYKIKNRISLQNYLTTVKTKKYKNKIALIYATGHIISNGNRSQQNIDIKTITEELRKAEKDKQIKGIVLRVNSPGGSALASEIIYHEIFRLTKPLYVSMGSVAASGGYYISAPAKKIFATKSTITGSIGVVSVIPEINQLMKNAKINVEKIQKGKYAGMNSLTNIMSPQEKIVIRNASLHIYNEFKNRVSSGRNIPFKKIEPIAGGRVWLGEEGVQNGLVDEIGGLQMTIKSLAKNLKLKKYQVVEITKKRGLYETLLYYNDIYTKIERLMSSQTINLNNSLFETNKPLFLMPYEFN